MRSFPYRKLLFRFSSVLIFFTLSACTSITQRSYQPFIRELDGKSELRVTTYPAGFPRGKSGSSIVLNKEQSHGELYFQINIKDKSKNMGPNPHVKSIKIHSFTYQLGDGPRTELLTDYDYNFWMQGNRNYDKSRLPPIPYYPDSSVKVEIDFTLNGQKYEFKGKMNASENTSYVPTFIRNSTI